MKHLLCTYERRELRSLDLYILYFKLFRLGVKACSSKPCKNGGDCKNVGSSYKCKCKSGFSGRNCQGKHIAVSSLLYNFF